MTGLPGYAVSDEELSALGFSVHDLEFAPSDVTLATGIGRAWKTLGDVADSPGLYAFTVDDGRIQHVAYVGRTAHVWMVTKGYLPRSGGARGGQRYGRPVHAGATRQRVNILVAAQIAAGRRVRHWVRPLAEPMLAGEEERLIGRWRLREVGWNRG
jgi:hypothetical protein